MGIMDYILSSPAEPTSKELERQSNQALANELSRRLQTVAEMDQEITRLTERERVLDAKIRSLSEGQDFRSHWKESGIPHETIQRDLNSLRQSIHNWSRNADKALSIAAVKAAASDDPHSRLSLDHIDLQQFPDFSAAIAEVCYPGTVIQTPRGLNATLADLLEGVVARMIFAMGIMNPLGVCNRQFQEDLNNGIYRKIISADEKAAKRWLAACLKQYHTTDRWPPYFDSARDRKRFEEQYLNEIQQRIDCLLRPVFNYFEGDFNTQDQKLKLQVRKAINLGSILGQLESKLVLVDMPWFFSTCEKNNGLLSLSDMQSRVDFALIPEIENIVWGRVGLVVCPGLLKYGRDDGENWDTWSVWTKANVKLVDIVTSQNLVGDPRLHERFQGASAQQRKHGNKKTTGEDNSRQHGIPPQQLESSHQLSYDT